MNDQTGSKSAPKSAKTSAITPAVDAQKGTIPGAETAVSEAPKAEVKHLTPDEKAKLAAAFLAAQQEQDKAQAALDKAREAKSDVVKALVEGCGHKGPFSIGGRMFKAAKGKGEGNESWTMREESPAKETFS